MGKSDKSNMSKRTKFSGSSDSAEKGPDSEGSLDRVSETKIRPVKWSLGILNDKETDEVPGSILLMSEANHNEPLGLRNTPSRTSASSLPSPYPPDLRPPLSRTESLLSVQEKKRTADGGMILEPQPDDSMNDPLNWPSWRRDVALLSLGFYCMLGGGMTPVLAAGFQNVADTYNVSIPQVALTTGLYMMGLGLGSVVASPTAILFGKRPVYLVSIILFAISALWCALSPNYPSLVVARIFQGLAVSPVECLPSATIAEIFFLHERAYRLGVYTLLLLSGKNLIPLVSAAIIQSLSWRWVFWIVAIVVGFCLFLMFFFVPETFWDRTPRPRPKSRKLAFASISDYFVHSGEKDHVIPNSPEGVDRTPVIGDTASTARPGKRREKSCQHVEFATRSNPALERQVTFQQTSEQIPDKIAVQAVSPTYSDGVTTQDPKNVQASPGTYIDDTDRERVLANSKANLDSPSTPIEENHTENIEQVVPATSPTKTQSSINNTTNTHSTNLPRPEAQRYTSFLRTQAPKTLKQTLKPWNGKLRSEKWFLVALRPFILFTYPGILWSTLVYSLSIGWLIVLSESVSTVYRNKDSYNFSSLGTGLIYISPFIGGVLGTAVAGKVSDFIVRFMSRRNGGIYEPEFRLVMAIPVAISTCIGLMGFGWSVEERDKWIIPTVFFAIISFGCSLGSTTAITFAVDSYRQYAGEALVTLNFSKNIFHGLVFSLFFNRWLEADGSKDVFLAIGGIQLACMLTTVPMYIYGKRARMFTVRKSFMEKF